MIRQSESSPAIIKNSLPSPEKLVGPTGREMEEAAAAAENQRIEEKVALLLRALEDAWDDNVSDLSRDMISGTDASDHLEDASPICPEDLGSLPECPLPPLFMDFIDN